MNDFVTAKLFWSGDVQVVELPKTLHFQGDSVRIKQQGQKLIIEPMTTGWDFVKDLEPFDSTMEQAIEELRKDPIQERDWSAFE